MKDVIDYNKINEELYISTYYTKDNDKYVQFSKLENGKWEYAIIKEHDGSDYYPHVLKRREFKSFEDALYTMSQKHPHLC